MWFPVFLCLLGTSLTIIWSVPFTILKIWNFHLFRVTNRDDIQALQRSLRGCSSIIRDQDKPCGFVWGRWFLGYFTEKKGSRGERHPEVYLLTDPETRKALLGRHASSPGQSCNPTLNVWERSSCFFDLKYMRRGLDISAFRMRPSQKDVFQTIITRYHQHHHVTALLSGAPGVGKSIMGLFLARELNGHYCKDWNPLDPGDSLSHVYRAIDPTPDAPLILVLDEIDCLFTQLSRGIQHHKYISIPVRNKQTWNQMLDDVSIGAFPNLVILMTTNQTSSWFDERDGSMLRSGRIDLKIQMHCESEPAHHPIKSTHPSTDM